MKMNATPIQKMVLHGLAHLPLVGLHLLGYALGVLAFLARPKSRARAVAFVRQAKIPRPFWTALQSYGDFGRSILEAPWLWINPPEKTWQKTLIELDPQLLPYLCAPMNSVTRASAQFQLLPKKPAQATSSEKDKNRSAVDPVEQTLTLQPRINPKRARSILAPLIFMGFHQGCSEAAMINMAHYFRSGFLYQKQKNPWLLALRSLRHPAHTTTIHDMTLGGIRTAKESLATGGSLGISVDQTPREGGGEWLDFFGKEAYTMTLAPKLSLTEKARVVHTLHIRHWGRFTLKFTLMDNLPDSVSARALIFNKVVEGSVRQWPTQYRWAYDRYRTRARH